LIASSSLRVPSVFSRASPRAIMSAAPMTTALPMRPTSRVHREFDITAEIALIEREINGTDDAREKESRKVCASHQSYVCYAMLCYAILE
jgi:hypothetical protein